MIKNYWNVLAVIFILWGLVSLITPLTPGSWLLIVGLVIIFGKDKTEKGILHVIGKKLFKKFKIKEIIDKMSNKTNHKK